MVEIRHLQNAPITEALIDFRVRNSNAESLEKSLDTLKERIGDRYPLIQVRSGFKAEFEFLGREVTERGSADTGFQGYFFRSQDGLNVIQFRSDGFTFNRLKPYTSWDEILPEAVKLWELYIEVAKPEYVARVGLRYINHLKIPLPVSDFSHYLTAPPNLPRISDSTRYYLSGFLTRLLVEQAEWDLEAAITQALEPGMDPNSVIIILDIDTSKTKDFEPQSADIVSTLNALRQMKNRIFFASITEETLRSFNGS